MRKLPQDEARAERAWLEEQEPGGYYCGYEVAGWPDATWVLHAMYEKSHQDEDEARDDTRGRSIVVGASGAAMSSGLGYAPAPSQAWSRLPWRDFAKRLGFDIGEGMDAPPCFRWFPTEGWTGVIESPPEGSLDERSFLAIIETVGLVAPDPNGAYYAFYGEGPANDKNGEITMYSGSLPEITDYVRSRKRQFSPSNIWPADRSWLVATDWDLWGTQVGGSHELIASIETHPQLETFRWDRPPATD